MKPQMNEPSKQFEAEKAARIEAFGKDTEFQKLSRDWLEKSMRKSYVYNFSWLGRPIIQNPIDIMAMQEIICAVKPDLIIETGIAHGGSRLSAVRWSQQHAVADILDLDAFDEDDLYDALPWLATQQERIETALYQAYVKDHGAPPALVLYDVTSSYFEGECKSQAT